ncbi:MAG: OmpA family protein [Paracoccaceae bacterium]
MRKVFGIGVLVLGVVALGLWGRGHQAHRMQGAVALAAETVVAGSVHGVTAQVSGRDILVSGIADGAGEHDALLAGLDALPGRRVVVDAMTVLDTAAPFSLNVVKADMALTATGFVPTEAVRGKLAAALGDSAKGLVLAAGAPEGWVAMAEAGIAALGPLIKGEMALSDGTLRITGEALSPVEQGQMLAALKGLPEGAVTAEVTLLDDGTPPEYVLEYSATTGATLAGKLPVGVTPEAIAGGLGLASVASAARSAVLGDGSDTSLFVVLQRWMGDIETLVVQSAPGRVAVQAGLVAGADAARIGAEMAAALGADVALEVAVAPVVGADGDERVNGFTGAKERLSAGYWLAVPGFAVSVANCQAETDKVLATRTINFVSGSDKLDADNLAVLNELASVVRECALSGTMTAEIGGHTDASGDVDANRRLSQLRALAVREALIARGIPRVAMLSKGYGAGVPFADNATEEGRALNRRTTVIWSE